MRKRLFAIGFASFVLALIVVPAPAHAGLDSILGDVMSWFGNVIGGATGAIVAGGLSLVLYPLTLIASFFVSLSAWIFEFTMQNFVLKMGDWITGPSSAGIREAWKILRDIANIGIVAGLVATAIGTILSSANWNVNKNLARLIIAALLVNFSYLFAGAIIDASNLTTKIIYKQMIQGAACQGAIIGGTVPAEKCTISDRFLNVVNPWSFSRGVRVLTGPVAAAVEGVRGGIEEGSIEGGVDAAFNYQVSILVEILMTLVFEFVAMWVLLSAVSLLVARYVSLIFLLVMSPIGIAGGAIPILKQYADEWWKAMISQAVFAPIYVFVAGISLRILELSFPRQSGGDFWERAGNFFSEVFRGFGSSGSSEQMMGTAVTYMIATAFMVAALRLAKNLADRAAWFKDIYKYSDQYLNFTKPIVGTAWRMTAGAASEAAYYGYNKRVAPWFAQGKLPKFLGGKVNEKGEYITDAKIPFMGGLGKRLGKSKFGLIRGIGKGIEAASDLPANAMKGTDRTVLGRIQGIRGAKPFGISSYEEEKKAKRGRQSEVEKIAEGNHKEDILRRNEGKKEELNTKEQQLDADLQSPTKKHSGDVDDDAFNKRKQQADETLEQYKARREIELGLASHKKDGKPVIGLREEVGLLWQREMAESRTQELVKEEKNRRGTRYTQNENGQFWDKTNKTWISEAAVTNVEDLEKNDEKDENGNYKGKLLRADYDPVSTQHRRYKISAETGDYAFVGTDGKTILTKAQLSGKERVRDKDGRWVIKDGSGAVVGTMVEDFELDDKGNVIYRDLDGNITDDQRGQKAYNKKTGKLLYKGEYEVDEKTGKVKLDADGKPIRSKSSAEAWDESPYDFEQRMEQRTGLKGIRDESSGVFADLDESMIQYWYDENPEKIADLGRAWSTAQMKSIVHNKDFAKGVRNRMVDARGRGLKRLADEINGRLKIDENKEYFVENGVTRMQWKKWKDASGVEHDPDIEQFSPEHNSLKTKLYFQTRNVYSKDDLVEFGVLYEDLLTNNAYIDAMLSSKLKDLQDDPRISVAIKRKMRNIRRWRYRTGGNMANYGVLGLSDESGKGEADDYEANVKLSGVVSSETDAQRRAVERAQGVVADRTKTGTDEEAAALLVLASQGDDGARAKVEAMGKERREAGRAYLREEVRAGDERVRRYMGGKTGEEIYREIRQEDLGGLWIAKNITTNQRNAQHERDQNWLTTLDRNIYLVGRDNVRKWMVANPDGETTSGGARSESEQREAENFRRVTGYGSAPATPAATAATATGGSSGGGGGTKASAASDDPSVGRGNARDGPRPSFMTPPSGTPRATQQRLAQPSGVEAATQISALTAQYAQPPSNPEEGLGRVDAVVNSLPATGGDTPAGRDASKGASDIIDTAIDAVPDERLPELGELLERPEVIETLTLGQLQAVLRDKKRISNKTKRAIIALVKKTTMRHGDGDIKQWLNSEEGKRIESEIGR